MPNIKINAPNKVHFFEENKMLPTIHLFGRQIGLYVILAICGALVAGTWACYTARKRGYDDNPTVIILLFGALGAFLGGFLLYGAFNFQLLLELMNNRAEYSFREFLVALRLVFGGTVFFGGLMGGLLGGFITAQLMKLPLGEYADMLTPAIPLFHVFGRIGCFLAGCCFGVESNFGVVFQNSLIAEANGVRRLPIQLVESALNLLLFLLLAYLLKKNKWQGRLLPLYIILYSVMRFILEFWRGDTARGFVLGISTSQFISLTLIILCVLFLVIQKIFNRRGVVAEE